MNMPLSLLGCWTKTWGLMKRRMVTTETSGKMRVGEKRGWRSKQQMRMETLKCHEWNAGLLEQHKGLMVT